MHSPAEQAPSQPGETKPPLWRRYRLPLSRAHLFWLVFALIVGGGIFYLHGTEGDFITIGGFDLTAVRLGEVGAVFIFASAAYTFRKRLFIGGLGVLDSWLWAHVYLGALGLLFIWYHSRQRFSANMRLANAAMFLLLFTGLTGVLGRVCYLIVPRILAGLKDYDPPARLRERIAALEVEAAAFVAMKSEPFVATYQEMLRRPLPMRPPAVAMQRLQTARAPVPAAEQAEFDRVAVILMRRGELLSTLRRRTAARRLLDWWWLVHVRLTEAGLILASIHILVSLLVDHRFK